MLREYGFDGRLLPALKSLYACSEVCVRVRRVKSRPFTVGVGVRQGCVLSPLLFKVNIRGSQPFHWREANQTYDFVGKPPVNFLTQFNLHVLFYSRTTSVTQNIGRFVERLGRAPRVPESRMRPSEPGLRTTGLHELDRQSQPSRRGCHCQELQNQPFSFYRRFGTASIFSTVFSIHLVFCCVRPSRNENQW